MKIESVGVANEGKMYGLQVRIYVKTLGGTCRLLLWKTMHKVLVNVSDIYDSSVCQ